MITDRANRVEPAVRKIIDRLAAEGVYWSEIRTICGKHFIGLKDLNDKKIRVYDVTVNGKFEANLKSSPIVVARGDHPILQDKQLGESPLAPSGVGGDGTSIRSTPG